MIGAVKEGVILAIGEAEDLEAFFPDPAITYWELETCPCCSGAGWRYKNADGHSADSLTGDCAKIVKREGLK